MFTVIYNLIAVVYKSFRHFEFEWYNHMAIPSQRIVTFTLNGKLIFKSDGNPTNDNSR